MKKLLLTLAAVIGICAASVAQTYTITPDMTTFKEGTYTTEDGKEKRQTQRFLDRRQCHLPCRYLPKYFFDCRYRYRWPEQSAQVVQEHDNDYRCSYRF